MVFPLTYYVAMKSYLHTNEMGVTKIFLASKKITDQIHRFNSMPVPQRAVVGSISLL